MLRSILRSVAGSQPQSNLGKILLPGTAEPAQLTASRSFSAKKNSKPDKPQQANKNVVKKKGKKDGSEDNKNVKADDMQLSPSHDPNSGIRAERLARLAQNAGNKSLDVRPDGRPLFTATPSISKLSRRDVCHYMDFSEEELRRVLPEGLPLGMEKEFEDSMRPALLVRQSFLDLRDNFGRIVDPPMHTTSKIPQTRRKIVLDGPRSCGKSIALAMLVHWARNEGWLVFYVPRGREWTHGGFFYKNPQTGLWDTPVQAANILQDFVKYNKKILEELRCNITEPVPLGEGAGVGWMRGVDTMPVPEGSTLYDLAESGIKHTHASVGALARLREELLLVDKYPVLFAIDQYNSWFTFSEYEEPVTVRSCRPIHARELTTVNAFRSMMHKDMMMVGAFSHSTAVGKLRQELPNVPPDSRVNLPRYSLDEAATVCHYYARQQLANQDAFSEDNWKKIYYLANGNGTEMRQLMPLMR
ncbi:OLC1v1006385C1 [Oldenlandia corymbosa var. corymbosa]|uniref:Small ribosomal subunit protein mS29 n=1 Tax=Oldenlandia corymbosa var. corymbosa TaxID=529605 RepID=A0AAV1DGW4_OLDCO|nr:OLC1v1006385C1 [Oldenlandia corymbosa var. corymbosa]